MLCKECPYWYTADGDNYSHCQCPPNALAPCETFDEDELADLLSDYSYYTEEED